MENQIEDKYRKVITESRVVDDDALVAQEVQDILSKHFDENNNKEVYTTCFNAIDLTSLNSTDTVASISAMVDRVNSFESDFPELPHVAAICVYPNFAVVVSGGLEVTGVSTAVVSGSFPSSQTFVEVKTAETALAVADGANEVDIVLNLGLFYGESYEELADEISEIKHAARGARLKVILETGALKTAADIKKASILSMYSGADFIKTSTGFSAGGATREDIALFAAHVGPDVRIKAAGGIKSFADAEAFIRLGASRLGTSRLVELAKKETAGENGF